MNVHRELGPGFKEIVYHQALIKSLSKDLQIEMEKQFDVYLGEEKIGNFRADLVVKNKVIVEVKAVSGFMPKIFYSQVTTYLKASKIEVGLQINFGNPSLDFKRFVYTNNQSV